MIRKSDIEPYSGSADTLSSRRNCKRRALSVKTVGKLHAYVVALSAREVTIETVADDWPDFFELARAFIVAYGSDELSGVCGRSHVLGSFPRGAAQLTLAERRCLISLAREMRRHLMTAPG